MRASLPDEEALPFEVEGLPYYREFAILGFAPANILLAGRMLAAEG